MAVHDMYHEESVVIAASRETVYDTIRQLERMGEWSPESTGGEWTSGDGTSVGDQFDGVNKIGDRVWTATATVLRADPGEAFTFHTGPSDNMMAEWSYLIEDADGGSKVTEVWEVHVLPPTLAEASAEQLAGRAAMVQESMRTTLAGLKATLES